MIICMYELCMVFHCLLTCKYVYPCFQVGEDNDVCSTHKNIHQKHHFSHATNIDPNPKIDVWFLLVRSMGPASPKGIRLVQEVLYLDF